LLYFCINYQIQGFNEDMEKLFTLIALSCTLRNGDADLKNFGMVYDDVQGEARFAPVYDLSALP
jgi:serine/threonine-protein kinase HipA